VTDPTRFPEMLVKGAEQSPVEYEITVLKSRLLKRARAYGTLVYDGMTSFQS
jgi:hypothetical protein